MKNVLKVEELGLMALFTFAYFHFCPGDWGLYLGLFFVPDISFAVYADFSKAGAIAYNILHHKGVMAVLILTGVLLRMT